MPTVFANNGITASTKKFLSLIKAKKNSVVELKELMEAGYTALNKIRTERLLSCKCFTDNVDYKAMEKMLLDKNNEVQKKYPMLRMAGFFTTYSIDENEAVAFSDYINQCDVMNP